MNSSLFLALLTAHLLSDFTFQWESFCKNKTEKGFKGYALYIHAAIVLIVTTLIIEPWSGLCGWVVFLCVAGIAVSHLLIDGLKSALERKIMKNKTLSIVELGPFIFLSEKQNPVSSPDAKSFAKKSLLLFLGDQAIHIGLLVAVSFICNYGVSWTGVQLTKEVNLGLAAVAFLLCGKAGNHLIMPCIRYIFAGANIPTSSPDNKTANVHAGAMIGILERWLILIFLLAGQYEPIGFLVAAKSIIRYKEADTSTTEYVLTGTLFSIALAVICGVLIFLLKNML